MNDYIRKIPVWAFCAFMFQIGGILTQDCSVQAAVPVMILLAMITLDDVVFRMMHIASGKTNMYQSVTAPISLALLCVYQFLVRMKIGFVSQQIFLVCFPAALIFIFFLAAFPLYHCRILKEK